uniref:Uncharacterized protein n=1 Tax=Plectus sambesii TaxID=2011161 RepID=A0A914VJR6_9BILA
MNRERGRGARPESAMSSSSEVTSSSLGTSEASHPTEGQIPTIGGDGLANLATKSRARGRGQKAPAKEETTSLAAGNVKALGGQMSALRLRQMAERPDYGARGRLIQLWTNWFTFSIGSKQPVAVYQYDVDISSSSLSKMDKDRRQFIFWEAVRQHPEVFGDDPSRFVYDDGKILFSREELLFKGGLKNGTLEFQARHPRETRTLEWTMVIQKVRPNPIILDVSVSAVPQLVRRDTLPIQCIDLVLSQNRRYPFNRFFELWYGWNQRVYCFPEFMKDSRFNNNLGEGKEVWRGLFASASVGQGYRPIINFDVAHSVFYQDMTLADFATEIVGRNRNDMNRPFNMKERELLNNAVKGIKFQITHRGEEKRVYRAKGVDEAPVNIRFTKEEANGGTREVSVAEYFAEDYRPLQLPNMPTVVAGGQKRIFFPLEVCKLYRPQKVPLSISQNERVKASMIEKTRLDAPVRKQVIEKLVKDACLNAREDPFLRSFEINIDASMLSVSGRILAPPTITAKDKGKRDTACHFIERMGSWKTENVQYSTAATCSNFAFICMNMPATRQKEMQEFCYLLVNACRERGMHFDTNVPEEGNERSKGTQPYYVSSIRSDRELDDAFHMCKKETEKHYDSPLELVFVCLDGKDARRYGEIKSLGDLKYGIPTQVVQWKTISAILRSASERRPNNTLQQLILKVNAKLGGVNFKTESQKDDLWQSLTNPKSATLFLGIDVTHPGAHEVRESQSIGAVVGNVDFACHKFDVSYRVQKRFHEQMVHFTKQLKERLFAFLSATKEKPARIIVFRDGISDSQFEAALHEEVTCIEQACRSLDPEYKPKITYIVVQKRHHTRFFPQQRQDTGQGQNVPPGTAVDTVVTHPIDFDYFLCSHLAPKGTARPAHYVVLFDESNFSSDDLQAITYRLCFHNARCAKSGSIPAPTFFADLCCTRANYYLQHFLATFNERSEEDMERALEVNERLKLKMYWI